MARRPKGFGGGLDPIIKPDASEQRASTERFEHVPIGRIRQNPFQPRSVFRPEALAELTDSIRQEGVVQPVVLRLADDGIYELIAGERRWRAADAAGLQDIPAIVREVSDRQALAVALIENLQREDLNPIDEARGLRRLIEEFELSHQEAAELVGRSRVAVSNLLRLLELHADVQSLVLDGGLEMGHARALLGLETSVQPAYAKRVAEGDLNVRQTEQLVRSAGRAANSPSRGRTEVIPELPSDWSGRVRITHSKAGAQVRLSKLSQPEVEALLDWLRNRDT